MKRFKSFWMFLLVGLLALTLAACGNSSSESEAKEPDAEASKNTGDTNYPEKPVTLVVPWGSGGNADVFARKAASIAEEHLGVEMVVENRTGAGGEIALTDFAVKQPDAHTILTTSASNFSLAPKVKDLQYSFEDFQPVIGNFSVEFILMTNPSKTGIETMEDLIEYSKDNKVKYAAAGSIQADTNLVQAALFEKYGIDAEAVVVDGGMEMMNSLLGGHVDVTIGVAPIMNDYLKSGELKALGTFADFPYELEGMEPIPPLSELGYEVTFVGFNFFNVSKETSPEVAEQLNNVFKDIFEDPEFQEYVESNNLRMSPIGSEEIKQFVEEQSSEIDGFLEIVGE